MNGIGQSPTKGSDPRKTVVVGWTPRPRPRQTGRDRRAKPPINRPLAYEYPVDHPIHPADPNETWVGLGDLTRIITQRALGG